MIPLKVKAKKAGQKVGQRKEKMLMMRVRRKRPKKEKQRKQKGKKKRNLKVRVILNLLLREISKRGGQRKGKANRNQRVK